MCGVAGILSNLDQKSCKTALGHMLRSMSHRGPDDQGEETMSSSGATLYLGHRRLSIIDLSSRGHQPMSNDHKTVWISTNGELYNFKELREELKHKYTFNSSSDTEVILKAYEEWGVNCLEKFRGMFAFAIWDAVRQTLFLARDPMGIKPLYYHSAPGYFLFASEIRAIQASGLAKTGIDPRGLYSYLSFGCLQSPETVLSGVSELKPAHYLLVSAGKITEKRYWSPLSDSSPITSDILSQVRECIEESIKIEMVSDVPLGAFLSGGIDSSAVTGLMSRFHDTPVKTLSIAFEEKEFDESEYSKLIATRFATDHHVLRLSEIDLLDALPAAIMAMDQPTMDGINTFLISKAARSAGLTVALSGLGGDELFCGYDSFQMVPKLLQWENTIRAFPKSLQTLAGQLVRILCSTSDRNVKLAHFLDGKINSGHVYFLFRALFCHDQLNKLLVGTETFESGERYLRQATQDLMDRLKTQDPVNQVSYLELTQYTANMLLRDTDMMSMANSLEVRVPLMDHKLAELMFRIPGYLKINPRTPKSLLVDAVGLPEKAVFRKKMGFTLPFETWMRAQLKNEVENVLLSPVTTLEGLISQTAINQIWKEFCDHKISWSRPWSLYVLKKWVERNIRG